MVHVAVVPAVMWTLSVQVFEPDDEVAVWLVSAEPALLGTVQDTVIVPLPPPAAWDTVTPVGAFGIPVGTTVADGDEDAPVPAEFTPATVKV